MELLLALMRVSSMWQIQCVHSITTNELLGKVRIDDAEFPPFLHFHIGVSFEVQELIQPTFSTLVCSNSWTSRTLDLMVIHPHEFSNWFNPIDLIFRA